MKRDSTASDSHRLVYRDPAYLWIGVPLLALGLFLASGSLASIVMNWLNHEPIFGKHGFQSVLFGYLLEIGILVMGARSCTEQELVIEREYNRITKTKRVFFWKQTEVFDIRTFDTVSWRSESKSDGDHRRVRYPVTLSGPSRRVDLFEEVSKSDALRAVGEIEQFLQLEQAQDADVYVPTEGELNVSSGTTFLIVKGFTLIWYVFCSVFVLAGLVFAGTSGWAALQGKMEVGPALAFIAGSLLFTGMAVVFIVIGRKSFPAMLDRVKEETAREQSKRVASPTESPEIKEVKDKGGLGGNAIQTQSPDSVHDRDALLWRHLKWLFIIPGLMLGCETQVATTLDGEEVAIRDRIVFPWNNLLSATELAKEIDPEKFAKIQVSRIFAFGAYSSSSSASVPGAKSKRNNGKNTIAKQDPDQALTGRWRQQTDQLKAWLEEVGGKSKSAQSWHIGTKDVEADFEIDLSQSQIQDEHLGQLAKHESQAELYLGSRLIRRGLIQSLNLNGLPISDAGVAHLKDMRNLRALYLNDTRVTDNGLEHLEGVTELYTLSLDRSAISDAGLISLTSLPKLTFLRLSGTQLSDAGIEHLKKLTTLKELEIVDCQISAQGVQELRQALPGCEIVDR